MRKLTSSLLAVATLMLLLPTASSAQRRPPPDRDRQPVRKHCDCFELERRLEGLENVLRYARLDRTEERRVDADLRDGYHDYRSVDFRRDSLGEQARKCSQGNMTVDRSWGRWQPWLAQRRLDPGNRCR